MASSNSIRDKLLGLLVGRYRLVERIGAGGMGVVYKAVHTEIPDLIAAVKLLSQNCIDDDSLRQRFKSEAAICARLGERSPNIVQIRDYGILEDLDLPYYTMEYLQGRTLESVLQAEAPLSLSRTGSIARQLCEGLKVAHDQGVVHRDLKPANIFLTPDRHMGERVKILDFGIAKFLYEATAVAQESASPLTCGYLGTPNYSSPEQLQGEEISPASDIYSLGLILYECLSGTTPFEKEDRSTFAIWVLAHTQQPPRLMNLANPGSTVPGEIEGIILRCLAKRPSDRPANTLEISQGMELSLRTLRHAEDRELFERAQRLAMAGRWHEAAEAAIAISYDSPVHFEAQTALKNWQLEAEYQRVLERAVLLAAGGDFSSLVQAVTIAATIPLTSLIYPQVQSEAQRWLKRLVDSIEALAWEEKWPEALQRAELVSSLPGAARRLDPLIEQWQKEQQAGELLKRAETFVSDRNWEQAHASLDSVPPGTIGYSRALQRKQGLVQSGPGRTPLPTPPVVPVPQESPNLSGRPATVLSTTPLAQTPPVASRRPKTWLWAGGLGVLALGMAVTWLIKPGPSNAPYQAVRPTPSTKPQSTQEELLFRQASTLQSRGDYKQALAVWNQLISSHPKGAEAYLNRALARSRTNNLSGAEADLTKAISQRSNYADAYLNRAAIRNQRADYKGALKDYEAYLLYVPQGVDTSRESRLVDSLRKLLTNIGNEKPSGGRGRGASNGNSKPPKPRPPKPKLANPPPREPRIAPKPKVKTGPRSCSGSLSSDEWERLGC